ncbi:uncharacterized protein LOC111391125 [Olea europaea var. sylvestris]|uniref:uncharacterized protein LOC111391125 n=1 Tax=Olea europaea var. sylvestris TaxID=158386 RepID=UPI000C1CEA58|nr:uncharacterized protein LOC111391125 [Olea europaea var. sylvestris]
MAAEICKASSEHVDHIYDNEVTVVSVAEAGEVEEGRVFRDKEILKLSLSLFAIRNMFKFMVERSDKKEYVVSTIYTPKDICSEMLHTFGVYLNYTKAWRCREQTLKMIMGDPTESFSRIPSFFYMIQQKNPGTVTYLEIDSHNRFKYCFMALGASIRGWPHCRPVIVVDGTYLNGHCGGTLFTVCTQDASNSIFVLTFGVGDNENDNSWRWFLEKLKEAYGYRERLCFVSDRHSSIKKAIEHVYPGACHGICSYHLLQNLKHYYEKSGENITQAFNSAVRAYTLEEFEYNMHRLHTMNENITGYLAEVGPEKWSRIHMPVNRFFTMTSNIVESVNAVTKAAKNYPIVSLIESLRQTVQTWFCKHRDEAHGTFTTCDCVLTINACDPVLNSSLLKFAFATLSDLEFASVTRIHDIQNKVSASNQTIFSVINNDRSTFVVDIEERTCTCRMMQVDLMPCPHALVVIAHTKRDPYAYCSYYYTNDAFLKAYEHSVYPIGNPDEWTVPNEVQNQIVLPPDQK